MNKDNLQNNKFSKSVEIAKLANKGYYYISPFVHLGCSFRTLPLVKLKISETDDETLLIAAIEVMKYCRPATLEEAEEYAMTREIEVIFDSYGFKKIAGFGSMSFFRKGVPNVSICDKNDNQLDFWYICNETRESGHLYCSVDCSIAEKAKFLREALNRSIDFK